MDDVVGGAWFVTSSNLNGVPDATCASSWPNSPRQVWSAAPLPIQVFPLGEGIQ